MQALCQEATLGAYANRPRHAQKIRASLIGGVSLPSVKAYGHREMWMSPKIGKISGRGARTAPVCMIGFDPVGPTSVVKILSAVLTSAAVALGALMLGEQAMLEQDQLERGDPCPTCGGSGYEPCVCRKWSDGDVGCNACSKTGYMKCRSCGGGGTAVPIPITIRRDEGRRM